MLCSCLLGSPKHLVLHFILRLWGNSRWLGKAYFSNGARALPLHPSDYPPSPKLLFARAPPILATVRAPPAELTNGLTKEWFNSPLVDVPPRYAPLSKPSFNIWIVDKFLRSRCGFWIHPVPINQLELLLFNAPRLSNLHGALIATVDGWEFFGLLRELTPDVEVHLVEDCPTPTNPCWLLSRCVI